MHANNRSESPLDPRSLRSIVDKGAKAVDGESRTVERHREKPIDQAQAFWDCYRKRMRAGLWTYKTGSGTRPWTKMLIQAALEACEDFVRAGEPERNLVRGRELPVVLDGRRRPRRFDVYARDSDSGERIIVFESETARWGQNGASGKDWREEFAKLCKIEANLRVLSSTFKWGTGSGFDRFLEEKLELMKDLFRNGPPGDFCLIFGPDWTLKDPGQEWLAYSLDGNYKLRRLDSACKLRPQRVIQHLELPTQPSYLLRPLTGDKR